MTVFERPEAVAQTVLRRLSVCYENNTMSRTDIADIADDLGRLFRYRPETDKYQEAADAIERFLDSDRGTSPRV